MNNNPAVAEMTYQNHDASGYFLNSTPVDIHPLDGTIMPAPYGATLKKFDTPIPENKWPKLVNDQWVFVVNYLGTVYWDSDHQRRVIERYEETVPTDSFLTDPGPKLSDIKESVKQSLMFAYAQALNAPVPYTAENGETAVYQHDAKAMAALAAATASFASLGKVPDGYYWVAFDNTRVPFTLQDLTNLSEALGNYNFEQFNKLQNYKDALDAITTSTTNAVELALSIIWQD